MLNLESTLQALVGQTIESVECPQSQMADSEDIGRAAIFINIRTTTGDTYHLTPIPCDYGDSAYIAVVTENSAELEEISEAIETELDDYAWELDNA